ncbi:MAG: hypothetical protein EHM28_06300 [Spirochaetaceae bacterium]|nr:MAG: hypothetical protein EHM28_06300 [Spirochaetaceae bacterium]
MKHFIIIISIALLLVNGVTAFAHDRDEKPDGEVYLFDKTGDEAPVRERKHSISFGIVAASELDTLMFSDDPEIAENAFENHIDGIYGEFRREHTGFGFTALARFIDIPSAYPGVEQEWQLYWIGSMDFRYHFFEFDSFLDPTAEFGIGCAGSIDLPVYDDEGNTFEDADLTGLSIFAQVGAGFAVNFKHFVIGAKVFYRFYNEVPPTTPYAPVALSDFQASLSMGLKF